MMTLSFSPADNVQNRIHRTRLIAWVPVLIAALINTGYQYFQARRILLENHPDATLGSWPQRMLHSYGSELSGPTVWEILVAGSVHLLPIIVAAVVTAGIWERIFSSSSQRRFDIGIFYPALLFCMLMPPSASLFHVVFGMSFGIVLGHSIFGGEGKSFLNPALVGAALVQVSFPAALSGDLLWTAINGYAGSNVFAVFNVHGFAGTELTELGWWSQFIGNTQGLLGTTSVLAILLGGAILVNGKLASWRLLAGQIMGVLIAASLCNLLWSDITGMSMMPWHWHLVLGSFAFGAVFIATDPSSSCCTNSGRWIQGVMIGLLVVMLRVINPSHPDSVIPVLLLMSMIAPLIDHGVTWLNIQRRARA